MVNALCTVMLALRGMGVCVQECGDGSEGTISSGREHGNGSGSMGMGESRRDCQDGSITKGASGWELQDGRV